MAVFPKRLQIAFAALLAAASAQAEPPPHPFAADSPWPLGFGNSFNQQSTPFEGPLPGDELAIDFVGRDARAPLPSGLVYSQPYAPGIYVTYGTNSREIWKIVRTPETLSKADYRVERLWKAGSGVRFTSGYWVPDGQTGAYFLVGDAIVHIVDDVPGDPYSAMAERARLPIDGILSKRRGRLRDLDVALGFARAYSGNLIFTTTRGNVCAVASDLSASSLTCLDIAASSEERVRNSIALEPVNGRDRVFLTTTDAVLAVDFDPQMRAFRTVWREPFANSGTTPTFMGTRPGEPALLVVTTFPEKPFAETPYELVAFRRGELRPGESRIADRINIDFGLSPERISELKPTQNSLPVHGFTTVIANFNGIFTYAEPVAESALGAQAFVFDTERMRWNVLWTNRDVYFPNSMLAIGGTGEQRPIVYGIGLRGVELTDTPSRRRLRFRQPAGTNAPVWTLEALSLSDGRSISQWDIGTGAQWNLNGSGIQIGPDREILTSGSQGVYRLKPVE